MDMEKPTSSTCIEMDALLEAHLDDELGEFESARLRRHLEGCPRCRHELAWAQQIRQGLRELPQLACPQSVMESVRALSSVPPTEGPGSAFGAQALEAKPSAVPPRAWPVAPPRPRRLRASSWRAALIAASVAVALLTGWLLRPLLTETVSNPPETTEVREHERPSQTPADEPDAPEQASAPRAPTAPPAIAGSPADSPAAVATVDQPATAGPEATEPSPAELARAKEDAQLALACLGAVNRRAAVALRDRALVDRITETPERVLEHLSRQL
jgi:anti-sigma factor RsiW